ncbi:hypothetical protein EZV62_003730 [Acer yangbiense]|uniref:Disease resistance N-terminal domain-containing protein n=1 Tax=Acer yangbiense TaxID=1000413 RepID=A0A5C7II88_9ROSI|nr:hypothetical protein EZV62_003730 [Acer yangbiense]
MADAIISVILEQLGTVVGQQIQQEVKLVVGLKKEVKKLTSNFKTIQAVLVDADQRQVTEAAVAVWLEKLKDVSYDMDDVLDKWNTAIMKRLQIEGAENAHTFKRKGRWVKSFCWNAILDLSTGRIWLELPFYLEGHGGHMIIVIAEGTGQDLLTECMRTMDQQDASGNKLLQDIHAIPSNASDNVYCVLLAHSAIHGDMPTYQFMWCSQSRLVTGVEYFMQRVTERQIKVVIRLLSSTNQPSFLDPKDISRSKTEEESETKLSRH